MYSPTLPSTSALEGLGGQRHGPTALPPGKTRYPLYRRLGSPKASLDGCGKPRPHRDSNPDRPARSESLYRLSYTGSIYIIYIRIIYIYTGCNRRNGPNFGRVFLRSNYTDITQNTYIQSSMVTEILAREKC